MAVADKGIDIRQDANQLLIRVALIDSAGELLMTGTSFFYIYEFQANGTLFGYDFDSPFDFTGDPTNDEGSLTHQQMNGVDSGLWTKAITNITDFEDGAIYVVRVYNASAVPVDQFREFQWSGVPGVVATEAKQDTQGLILNQTLANSSLVPAGNTFWLDTDNGNDSNSGLTADLAVATFDKIFSSSTGIGRIALVPGPIVVYVMPRNDANDVVSFGTTAIEVAVMRDNVTLIGVNWPRISSAYSVDLHLGVTSDAEQAMNCEVTGFRFVGGGDKHILVESSTGHIHHNIFEMGVNAPTNALIRIYTGNDIRILHNDFIGIMASNDEVINIGYEDKTVVTNVLIAHNTCRGVTTFVEFSHAADCVSMHNTITRKIDGNQSTINFEAVVGNAGSTRCYSINDTLDGGVADANPSVGVDCVAISNMNIGTPVALDGGTKTIAGMLTKLADDNGGATFDAGLHSQVTTATNVNDIESVVDALALLLEVGGDGDATAIKVAVDALQTKITTARAEYLDNLNVSGLVASQAEVVAIQNNTRVVRVVPPVMERPDTGSTIFVIRLYLYDTEGNMEAPDSAPTVTVENQDGTDRSGNLISGTLDELGTGIYEGYYTLASGHAIEALYFEFTIIEGGATRKYANPAMVVDTTAVDFTTADRTKLGAIEAMLPSATYLKGSADADGGMDTADKADVNAEVDQSITDSGIVADIAAVPTAAENAAELQTTVVDGSLTFNDVMKGVAAMSRGVISRNGDVYQLKNQAGATLFTWTISSSGRAIS